MQIEANVEDDQTRLEPTNQNQTRVEPTNQNQTVNLRDKTGSNDDDKCMYCTVWVT